MGCFPLTENKPKRPLAIMEAKIWEERRIKNITLTIIQNNIVREKVEAIVNAANGYLHHGSGVAGAIRKAGGSIIQKQSDKYIQKHGKLGDGDVCHTGAGNLSQPIKYIIHTVGPVWHKVYIYIYI